MPSGGVGAWTRNQGEGECFRIRCHLIGPIGIDKVGATAPAFARPMSSPNSLNTDYLLRHAKALRRLAKSLLGDEHAADDVVQDAWVATLAGPTAPVKRPEAWVRTVVRSLALKRIRGDQRRAAREEFGGEREQTSAASVDDLAMRKALLGQVVESCLGLDEPYQTVLYLRYFEGLSPHELGERLGRSTATVKSQLHRGLEKLRMELDREVQGGRGVWSVGLAPLAGVRVETIPSVPTQSAPALPEEFIPGSTPGVPAMSLPIKIALLFSLSLSVLGALWWKTDSSESRTHEAVAELNLEGEPRSVVAAESEELLAENDAGPSSKSAATRKSVEAQASMNHEPSTLELMTDESALSVLVCNAFGHPVEGARLYLGENRSALNEIEQSDAAGHVGACWKLLDSTAEMVFAVQMPDGTWSGLRRFQAAAGSVHVGFVALPYNSEQFLREPAPRSGEAGSPAMKGKWSLNGIVDVEELSRAGHWLENSPRPGWSIGGFTAKGSEDSLYFQSLAAGLDISRESAPRAGGDWLNLVSGEHYFSDQTLGKSDRGQPSRFSGVVRDSSGEIARAAAITLFVNGALKVTKLTDSAGRFSFEWADAGEWKVVAGGGRFGRDTWAKEVVEGDDLFHEFRLERGQEVSGSVRDVDGHALAGCTVELESVSDSRGWAALAVADEHGEFSIPNVPSSSYRLLVRQPGAWATLPAHVANDVQPGGRYDLIVESATADFEFAVKDELGEAASAHVRLWNDAAGRGLATLSDGEGQVRFEGLPAGVYRIEVGAETRGWKDLGEVVLRAGEDVDWGLLSLDPPAKLAWTVDNEEGTARSSDYFFLISSDAEVGTVVLSGRLGGDRELDLAPGSYELILTSDGKPAGLYPFVAVSGQLSSLELQNILPATAEDLAQSAIEARIEEIHSEANAGEGLPLTGEFIEVGSLKVGAGVGGGAVVEEYEN